MRPCGAHSAGFGINNEPVAIPLLRDAAFNGLKALELLHHVGGLLFANDGGPVFEPDFMRQCGKGIKVFSGFDNLECNAHTCSFICATPMCASVLLRVPAVADIASCLQIHNAKDGEGAQPAMSPCPVTRRLRAPWQRARQFAPRQRRQRRAPRFPRHMRRLQGSGRFQAAKAFQAKRLKTW